VGRLRQNLSIENDRHAKRMKARPESGWLAIIAGNNGESSSSLCAYG
jgi:hypothetical protein